MFVVLAYISWIIYLEFHDYKNILEGALFLIMALGGLLNLIVVLANKGRMPVLDKNGKFKERVEKSYRHQLITGTSRLTFLADIYELGDGGAMVSLGDILTASGFLFLLVRALFF